ncbi:MAG TPA: phosphomannomutase/phosphoglucomutase [Candidatus Cloacimonetes bacterium]|nr:phosphomannomutase/phosphoglucomutase [Candidatus Cloacimonadota bacterium]HEX37455.1 phosphomannomutase/phosphoglucomutase [Candidatus Cloacimonadota bacterium]
MINPQIFREYDIRGIVDKDLTDHVVENIGLAFGTYLHKMNLRTVVIGGDCRLSSERFRNHIASGLTKTGCDVIDVGTVPTPVLYYAITKLETDGGVMVTGSHNPPDFNGFKLCVGTFSIYGEDIQKIREIIEEGVYLSGKGSFKTYDTIIKDYQDYIVENLKIDRPLTVVVDSGNGTAGPVAPDIFRRLGCEVMSLYEDMDGTFPNHHPDPTVKKNLEKLIETVLEMKADVGIGFDGDSDRIGAVDEKGEIVWGDQLLMIYSREVLKDHPEATVISEVKSSKNLYDDVRNHGGNPIMWKTGHSLIKEKMREEKALIGGEMSGHMFFSDRYFGFDDAIYAAGRLLEIISKSDKPLSEMLSDVPKMYNTPEIRIDCPDDKKFQIVEEIKHFYQKKKFDINGIDGMRITFDDGWALVRASNTQPVLVLRFEATSEARLEEIQKMIMGKVEEFIKAAS